MSARALFSVVVGVIFVANTAQAVVLCAKPRSDGTYNTSVKIREACRTGETELDAAELGVQGEQGPQGAQGPLGPAGPPNPGGAIHVYDAVGNFLGILAAGVTDTPTGMGVLSVLIPSASRTLRLSSQYEIANEEFKVRPAGVTFSSWRFSQPDCSGQAYLYPLDPTDPTELYTFQESGSSFRYFSTVGTLVVDPASTPFQSQNIFNAGCVNASGVLTTPDGGFVPVPYWTTATEVVLTFPLPTTGPLQFVTAP